MTALTAALWTETLKARRSRGPWLSALGFSLAPAMGGLFMVILRDPEWARRQGLITAKAQITAGAADWPSYFALLTQSIAIGGLAIFGLIAIWIFGREYGDGTVRDLLATPVSRESVVAAKLVVAACWAAALTVLVFVVGLVIGQAIDLPGWSADLAWQAASGVAVCAGLTILLVTPFALAASAGRGYLPPIGCMLLVIFLAQIISLLGWGAYFPWSVPALAAGAAGPSEQQLGAVSYLIVALTGLAGSVGTAAWWRWADLTN